MNCDKIKVKSRGGFQHHPPHPIPWPATYTSPYFRVNNVHLIQFFHTKILVFYTLELKAIAHAAYKSTSFNMKNCCFF